jgi:DNA-binding HxlR family transcriptional regulator
VVRRTVDAEVPPKVEYCLTPSGKTLKPVLDALHAWGQEPTRTHGRVADDGRQALDE